jgi:L-asparaginase
LEVEEFSNIPSFHMSPEIMLRLAQRVEELLADPGTAGAVITHGTDTLEETAYFIDLFLTPEKPVCLTGAMRSSSDVSSDGPYNILCATLAAASSALRGYGAMVVMNGEIHAARHVTKTHRSAVQTFASPNWGPLGYVAKDGLRLNRFPSGQSPLRPHPPLANVPIVKIYTGMDTSLFDALLAAGMDGLVLEGYGLGNVPAAIIPGVKKVLAAGLPIVAASRVPAGRMQDNYAVEGGAGHLASLGVILGGELNSQKARIKLMLALGLSRDRDTLAGYFEEDIKRERA